MSLRVAIVHDYLREYGGAERVVEALHTMFPDAPVYTAFVDKEALGIHWQRFADWDLRESIAAKIPGIKRIYSPFRILSAFFFEQFDFSSYDVVISSTNMYMAKAVRTHKPTVHICYCHTPPRSLYGYSTMTDWKKNIVTRIGGELINMWMRHIDAVTARRPDVFVANSKETQARIQRFYGRESVVIYPPVSLLGSMVSKKTKGEYYLYVGRLAKSKHADLAVQACRTLQLPLKVVGKGNGEAYLQSLAGETIEFLGAIDDMALRDVYANAKALIFPAEDEDFGIVPVEAMMMGVPVIAHASGGPLETIVEGKTGVFFHDLTPEAVQEAIGTFENLSFDPKTIQKHAQQFSTRRFEEKMHALIEQYARP